jgi:hypothetical protein
LAGSELNLFVCLSQEISPPVKRWEMTFPSSVWSATGGPSEPTAPPSLSHAAFIAPRTMNAP